MGMTKQTLIYDGTTSHYNPNNVCFTCCCYLESF